MTQHQQDLINKAIAELEKNGIAGYLSVQPTTEQAPLFTTYEIGAPKKPR